MINIQYSRSKIKVSQRIFAQRAGISYKALQLIEKGGDMRLSTLHKLVVGFGYSKHSLSDTLARFLDTPPDAISLFSDRIAKKGRDEWKSPLFNFVDAFRKSKERQLVENPPQNRLSKKMAALLASTVEMLCDEMNLSYPFWCRGIPSLQVPWFPSGMENLKATALVESPLHFRKRNIFVLGNFLERA